MFIRVNILEAGKEKVFIERYVKERMLIKKYTDTFFRDVTAFGGLFFYALVALVFLVLGDFAQSYRLIAGVVLIYVVAISIRTFYFKYRPSLQKFDTFWQRLDASSFPSVHAARAVVVAVVLGDATGNLTIRVAFGVLAVLVAVSRVYLREHDIIDVICGLALGALVAFVLVTFL